jgi:drug/metabolite transporter (DMT)-like permease
MAVFWGGTFIAGRSVAQQIGPFSAAFLRFVVASACLLMIVSSRRQRIQPPGAKHILPLTLLGLTGVFSYNYFFFKGLHLIEAGRAAIIIATNPVFIAFFASIIFKERMTPLRACGICLSVLGAIVVITRGQPAVILSGGLGWGEVFIFCCVASWVAYSLLGKAVLADLSPLTAVTCSSVIGALFLFFPAVAEGLFKDWPYSISVWGSILYLGVFGTVLGFVWFYQGIQQIGPTKAGLFINFVPISAVLLAFLMLEEPITWSLMVGVVLVSGGVYLTNRP